MFLVTSAQSHLILGARLEIPRRSRLCKYDNLSSLIQDGRSDRTSPSFYSLFCQVMARNMNLVIHRSHERSPLLTFPRRPCWPTVRLSFRCLDISNLQQLETQVEQLSSKKSGSHSHIAALLDTTCKASGVPVSIRPH